MPVDLQSTGAFVARRNRHRQHPRNVRVDVVLFAGRVYGTKGAQYAQCIGVESQMAPYGLVIGPNRPGERGQPVGSRGHPDWLAGQAKALVAHFCHCICLGDRFRIGRGGTYFVMIREASARWRVRLHRQCVTTQHRQRVAVKGQIAPDTLAVAPLDYGKHL